MIETAMVDNVPVNKPQAFGVDIGGSGIKAAPVDLTTGRLTQPRLKIQTPKHSTPEAVGAVVREQLEHFKVPQTVPVGVAFPAPVRVGHPLDFMANLDSSWLGADVTEEFSKACGRPVIVVNDADAAGIAEQRFGAAQGRNGLVVATTLGTGIGTALIYDGTLIPNTELGHVQLPNGRGDAEKYAAASVREQKDLGYKRWAKRLTLYYGLLEQYLNPDLFVIGGGVSREAHRFIPFIEVHTEIIPATLRNDAGIIGAAYRAASQGV